MKNINTTTENNKKYTITNHTIWETLGEIENSDWMDKSPYLGTDDSEPYYRIEDMTFDEMLKFRNDIEDFFMIWDEDDDNNEYEIQDGKLIEV